MHTDRTTTLSAASPLPAILACLVGIFLLSAMDAAVKGLVLAVGAYNALLWRSIMATGAAGLNWTALRGRRPSAEALRLHAQRGAVVSVIGFAFFWGLGRLPLAEAIALSFVAPLVALFLASRFGLWSVGAYLLSGAICTLAALAINKEWAQRSE